MSAFLVCFVFRLLLQKILNNCSTYYVVVIIFGKFRGNRVRSREVSDLGDSTVC